MSVIYRLGSTLIKGSKKTVNNMSGGELYKGYKAALETGKDFATIGGNNVTTKVLDNTFNNFAKKSILGAPLRLFKRAQFYLQALTKTGTGATKKAADTATNTANSVKESVAKHYKAHSKAGQHIPEKAANNVARTA